ncbi:MAG: 50S ribosomal protein L11 methyltransferase [Bacteroidota bacterium]
MAYLEFEIPARTWDSTQKEILFAMLAQIGFEGFVEGEYILQAYIDESRHSDQSFNEVIDELADLGIKVQYSFHRTENQNWNKEWEKKFEPVLIEDKVLIRAPFHGAKDDLPCTLIIEPKMSFGTGHHHTTRLMIMEMMNYDLKDKWILDMGCGTGVLGIYAYKMGAQGVVGIDNDRWAYQNALENVDLNGAAGMEVRFGDVGVLKEEKFDFVLANITRNTLVRDMQHYETHLVGGGIMIVSGFLAEDVQYVLNAAYRCNLSHLSTREVSNWISLSYKKK